MSSSGISSSFTGCSLRRQREIKITSYNINLQVWKRKWLVDKLRLLVSIRVRLQIAFLVKPQILRHLWNDFVVKNHKKIFVFSYFVSKKNRWTHPYVSNHCASSVLSFRKCTIVSSNYITNGRDRMQGYDCRLWYQLTLALLDFTQKEEYYSNNNMITVWLFSVIDCLVICRLYRVLRRTYCSHGIRDAGVSN